MRSRMRRRRRRRGTRRRRRRMTEATYKTKSVSKPAL